MPKFIIIWNIGYGDSAEVVEAEHQEAAEGEAYEKWHEEVEANADYSAQPYTAKLAEEHGLEDE